MNEPENRPDPEEPVPLPVDGVLDLHTFRPRDVKDVVLDYIELCKERKICELRIIHGKGIGELRRTVQKILERHPDVQSFAIANQHYGGSGATIVHLKRC